MGPFERSPLRVVDYEIRGRIDDIASSNPLSREMLLAALALAIPKLQRMPSLVLMILIVDMNIERTEMKRMMN